MENRPYFTMTIGGEKIIVDQTNLASYLHSSEWSGYDHHFIATGNDQGIYIVRSVQPDIYHDIQDQIDEANFESLYFNVIYSEVPSETDRRIISDHLSKIIKDELLDFKTLDEVEPLIQMYAELRLEKEIPLNGEE